MLISCIKGKFILKNNLGFSTELQGAGSKFGKSAIFAACFCIWVGFGVFFRGKLELRKVLSLFNFVQKKSFKNILRHKNFGNNIPEMISWIHSSISNMENHCYLGCYNARNIGQWEMSS